MIKTLFSYLSLNILTLKSVYNYNNNDNDDIYIYIPVVIQLFEFIH